MSPPERTVRLQKRSVERRPGARSQHEGTRAVARATARRSCSAGDDLGKGVGSDDEHWPGAGSDVQRARREREQTARAAGARVHRGARRSDALRDRRGQRRRHAMRSRRRAQHQLQLCRRHACIGQRAARRRFRKLEHRRLGLVGQRLARKMTPPAALNADRLLEALGHERELVICGCSPGPQLRTQACQHLEVGELELGKRSSASEDRDTADGAELQRPWKIARRREEAILAAWISGLQAAWR